MQARKQLVILFGGLGEAEAGVEDNVLAFDPGGEQVGGLRFEIGRDLGRDVAFVVGEGLHGPGIALHVHGDVGHAAARGRGGHLRVEFPGGDVVDDERTEFFDRTGGDFAAEGIDRNQDAGRQTPHGPDAQLHAPPLLVGRDFVGAGARRIAPHVDDRGALGGGLLHAAFDMRRVGHAAAGEERVGGDVQDRHHLRPGEVEINVVLLHG